VHERDQIRARITLNVELDLAFERAKQRGNFADVGRRDVTGISSWMNGDAWGPGIDTDTNSIQN